MLPSTTPVTIASPSVPVVATPVFTVTVQASATVTGADPSALSLSFGEGASVIVQTPGPVPVAATLAAPVVAGATKQITSELSAGGLSVSGEGSITDSASVTRTFDVGGQPDTVTATFSATATPKSPSQRLEADNVPVTSLLLDLGGTAFGWAATKLLSSVELCVENPVCSAVG